MNERIPPDVERALERTLARFKNPSFLARGKCLLARLGRSLGVGIPEPYRFPPSCWLTAHHGEDRIRKIVEDRRRVVAQVESDRAWLAAVVVVALVSGVGALAWRIFA